MSASLTLAPMIPWPVIAALATAGLLLVGLAAVRRGRAWPLRAAVLAVLVAALLNPEIVGEEREPRSDVAVLVVDESGSQRVGDRADRTAEALAAVGVALAAHPDLEVRVVRIGDDAAGGGTRLAAPLERAVAEIPAERRAGVVIITDGQAADLDPAAVPPALGAPVHVLLTGREEERDRRLVVEQAPAYGLVGREVTVTFRVEDLEPGGAPAVVRFRIDGRDAGAVEIAPGVTGSHTVTLDHAGPTVVEIQADTVPGELSALNNRAVVTLGGVRERLRVLLISGQPHPGERMWRNLLKSDPSVDLVHFTILRPPDKSDGASIRELSLIAFPVEELFEEKLYEFDLIVFDRYMMRGVLPWRYLAKINEYVEAGGALLLSAGPEYLDVSSLYRTPLGPILPGAPTGRLFETGFRPAVTDLGRRHPVTSALPGEDEMGDTAADADEAPRWGRWFRQVEVDATAGSTLMAGPEGRPLLIVDRVAEGRVALLASDHLWLWARGFDGGGPHAELTRRLVHWLMQEPELEEERLEARVDGSRLEVVRHSLSPETRRVTVTDPAGAVETLTLEPGADGVARGEVMAEAPGLYRVDDGRRTALAASGPLNPLEYADLRATAARLAPLAEASGGSLHRLAEGIPDVRRVRAGRDAAGDGWIGLIRNDASVVTGVVRVPLLPALAVLALALAGLAAAWWREGR